MKQYTFSKGVQLPDDRKSLSKDRPIEVLKPGKTLFIPLQQHMGAPAVPIVKAGDKVKRGQLIAEAAGAFSANVHSSVSGEVKGIVKRNNNFSVPADCIEIENDFRYDTVYMPQIEINKENVLKRIFDAGIVGMGGAGFPTSIKLRPKTHVDTLVINGAECEPYLTCDYRVMLEDTKKLLRGVELIAVALGIRKVLIGIEANKMDAIHHINAILKDKNYPNVKVIPLKEKYPQGSEKQLIYACTRRVVKCGGLPSDIGVVVQNIQTAVAVHNAVIENTPLYGRVMTVSGGAINEPKNLRVAVGTPYKEILDYCGGVKEGITKLIAGGPMMGNALADDSGVLSKTDGGLTALMRGEGLTDQPTPCINCGKCARNCPMNIMPMYIDFYTLAGDYEQAIKYGVKNCIQCGTCFYFCPAKRPLIQSIRLCKEKLREMKK